MKGHERPAFYMHAIMKCKNINTADIQLNLLEIPLLKTYLKKVLVTACDNSKIFLSFYLWLLSFYYSIRTSITVLEPY